jgi:hypothetical protein
MTFIKNNQERKKGVKILYSFVFISIFILSYSFLWPAFWNFVILPKTSPDSHGLRLELFKKGLFLNSTAGKTESLDSYVALDKPEHSALAFAVWEVPVSGRYRILLETDSTCVLNLDGKTVLKIKGIYPHNGDGTTQYLKQGSHLLLLKFYNGPNKGWVDFKVQRPGEVTFSRLSPSHLRYIKLNNFTEWWNIILFTKWALLSGLGLVLLFLWWPELSTLLRSKSLFIWLSNRNFLIWAAFSILMLLLVLGIWPLLWNFFILPQADLKTPGIRVDVFAGKEMAGNPVKSFIEPSTQLTLASPQSSLRAYAIWQVPKTGEYKLTLNCKDYGSLFIDEQMVISFPERAVGQTASVPIYLTQGNHLLVLRLTNFNNKGLMNFTVARPGSTETLYLSSRELISGPVKDLDLILKIVRIGKYVGLVGLSLALILLIIRLGNWGSYISTLIEPAPLSFFGAGVSLVVAVSLFLRILFLVDMHYPAIGAKCLALWGLAFSFGTLLGVFSVSLGKKIKNGIPGENPGIKGIETICLMAIMSIATIMRVLFLQNMEFKSDEIEMVHMAINLVRDHIPYVVGNLSSHDNRNPAGFLYLLSLPALISYHPIHITLFIVLLNVLAVFMTYCLVRNLLGWRAATVAALLFACSPWAIRCSMKVWPQHCVVFFALSLCLLLRTWYERGSWWRSVLLGVTAAMLSQLHFSSFLLLGGIVIFSLILIPKIPWKRLPVALLAFLLLWLPYIYYQAKHGPDTGHIIQKYIKEFPGKNLKTVRNVYWEVGGFFLDSDEAMGGLGKEFRASVWKPIYLTFYVWLILVLFGLYVFEFRYYPDQNPRAPNAVDWLKLYIWAIIFDLAVQVMINVQADISYVEFVFPWPFILIGLWVHQLEKPQPSKRVGKRMLYLPFIIVLLISVFGSAYFWSWQNFLGRTGGDGEYGNVFYRMEAAEIDFIRKTRPLPGPGPETKFSW